MRSVGVLFLTLLAALFVATASAEETIDRFDVTIEVQGFESALTGMDIEDGGEVVGVPAGYFSAPFDAGFSRGGRLVGFSA